MGVNIQTIKAIRSYLSEELDKLYPEPEINALSNIIIKTVTGLSKLHDLYLAEHHVTPDQAQRVADICHQLKSGKPIQYIIGETLFYDCKIKVNMSALIPRQETEELVDIIIRENTGFKGSIIDIGTGSGCIAIALAKYLPGASLTGIDISDDAIKLAKENVAINNVNVNLIKADIFNIDPELTLKADILVSNPPYIRNSEKQFMNRNVIDYEPHIALFVNDEKPLVYYKAIIELSEAILTKDGMVYFEINEAMGENLRSILAESGFSQVEIMRDINGKDRFVKGKKNA